MTERPAEDAGPGVGGGGLDLRRGVRYARHSTGSEDVDMWAHHEPRGVFPPPYVVWRDGGPTGADV